MGERVRGWWYPYIFLALLGIVIVVNGTMAYLATTTFNGVITEGAYEKGNDYNRVLAAAKEQAQMGWAVKTEVIPGSVGHAAEITVSFKNKDGKAIDGLDVQALADRPNVNGAEHRFVFAPKGNGVYSVQIDFPESGQWDFDFLASGDGNTYQMLRRFIIP